jgi:hypothetical protein
VYLELGSAAQAQGIYYPLTTVHLSTGGKDGLKLSFGTSSLVLLNDILHAAASGGQVKDVGVAFRAPGLNGKLTTESVDTFRSASVTSFKEQLVGRAAGTVALTLGTATGVVSTPGALERVGPFAGTSGTPAAEAYAATPGTSSAELTALRISQKALGDPLRISLTTSSLTLLNQMFRSQGAVGGIPVLTLSAGAGKGTAPVKYTFSSLTVGSFTEDTASGALSGTAALLTAPR